MAAAQQESLSVPAGGHLIILCVSGCPTYLDDAFTALFCVSVRYQSVFSMGCMRRSCCSVMTRRQKTCCSCCARPLRSRRETWWRPCCQVRRVTSLLGRGQSEIVTVLLLIRLKDVVCNRYSAGQRRDRKYRRVES